MKGLMLFLTIISCLFSCKKNKIETLTFQNCKIYYPIYAKGGVEISKDNFVTNEWEKESAYRELALCLCAEYMRNPTEKSKRKILEIYYQKEEFFTRDFTENISFEYILKNRSQIFNPVKYID
jgi:hypothetical protein